MKNFWLSENFALPETIITETIAVLGIRGSGKTTTAKVIVEEALKRERQVAIIDPTDAWWGLKSHFQIIVFGGAHGDLPLEEGSAKLLADYVVDKGVSVILSLRHLRKAAQKRLITAFNEQLYFRKGETSKRTPVLVVIDECDTFIPQKVMGEDAKSVGAVEDLVRRGRNAGIGVILISQRAASINKDVLTQLTVLIAHKHTSPQDRKALLEWIKGHDTEDRADRFLESLAALETGVAWIWAPDSDIFRAVRIRKADSFDSSATPKLGAKLRKPKYLKPVDLEELKLQMKEAIKNIEDNDPRKLRAEIARLQKELAAGKKVEVKEVVKEKPVLLEKDRKLIIELNELLHQVTVAGAKLSDRVQTLATFRPSIDTAEPKLGVRESRTPAMSMKDIQNHNAHAEVHQQAVTNYHDLTKRERDEHDSTPSKSIRKILTTLAQTGPMDIRCAAMRSGYACSGGFRNYISEARVKGWLEGSSDCLRITEAGLQILGPYEPLPQNRQERLEFWTRRLGRTQGSMLNTIYSQGPMPLEILAEHVGKKPSGGFRNYVSELRTLGLIEGTSKELRLSENF